MKEAWDKHIEPLLETNQRDNLSFIGVPFLERFLKLTGNQRIEVEDTLVHCAFDASDDETVRKALTIAEALHTSQLATGGLTSLMRNELRNQLGTLDMNRDITKDYVFALSAFGLTEAVPSIRTLAASVSEGLMSGDIDEAEVSNRSLLRACCLSLKRMGDDRVDEFVAILVEHDLRMSNLTTSELHSLSPERIVNSWDHLGSSGVRSITGLFHGMRADQRSRAMPLLEEATRGIDFHSDQERQEVMDLVDGLRNADQVLTASHPDGRMKSIRRKRSTQDALTGFVLSMIALGSLVALLALLYIRWPEAGQPLYMPLRATIYGVITIVVSMTFGFISAFSTLYDIRTFRANSFAFVLAALTLAVCALVFAGLGVLAYLILP